MRVSDLWSCDGAVVCAHFEQGLIEPDDLGLENLRPRVLRERRGLHCVEYCLSLSVQLTPDYGRESAHHNCDAER
jgi:hypothetical protein